MSSARTPRDQRQERTMSVQQVPMNFKQKIPDKKYLNNKRVSVFQKVDMNSLNQTEIPNYPKTKEQMTEIMPLLHNNFMTKNLNDELL